MKTLRLYPFSTDTPSSYPTNEMKELFTAILSIKSDKEATAFFRDLFTLAEIKEFANRWQAVKMLTIGKSYIEIANKLGMSTATVTRVAHWYKNGMGGYKIIADRMFEKKFKDSVSDKSFRLRGKHTFLKSISS